MSIKKPELTAADCELLSILLQDWILEEKREMMRHDNKDLITLINSQCNTLQKLKNKINLINSMT